ncbi:hypothetical protein HDU87_007725 [Geranomyces variabilis]|uniref:DUF221-domain-containing protein n=1 Tax=Geranomyces variabilis TaxID=109894 RepID=A0AAD5TEU7_9FUNG|nr:hypothetical protein HDU87_007725 [Geranomyces variabilis]
MSDPTVRPSDVSLSSFISAVVLASATGAAFIAVFTIIRERYPLVYAPRTFLVPDKILTKPLKGYFTWATLAWTVDDDDTLRRIGGDNFSALFYMRMLTRLFMIISAAAVVILIPIYATADPDNLLNLSGLNLLAIGNVNSDQQNRLWATLIMSVIFVAAVLHIIFKLLDKAAWLRHTFILGADQHQSLSGYTLLVRDIPPDLRDPGLIRDLFNRVQPNKVLDVILIRDVKKIKKVHKQHMKSRNAVEKASAKYLSLIAKKHAESVKKQSSVGIDMEDGQGNSPDRHLIDTLRPTNKAKVLFGEKRDTIDWNLKEMGRLESELDRERVEVYQDPGRAESAAFVIFADLFSPHVAALANIHGTPGVMLDKQAVVEPQDVIWNNLDMKLYDRMVRGLIVTVALVALIVFWGAINSALASIATLDKLATYVGFVDKIPKVVKGIIQGLLPTILVKILFSLLPTILRFFSTFQGAMTKTAQEKTLISQYYFFLLFNVFFIITISGSIFSTIKLISNDNSQIFKIISSTVPSVANFYVNYVTLLALGGPPGELLQIGALIVTPLKLRFLAGTPRAVWTTSQPTVFEAGVPFANHSFVATLGIIYMTAAPLVPVACAVYFGLWQIAYAYKMQYCYATRSQTGGFYMHVAAKQLFVALYIHGFIIFAMFLLKKAWVQMAIVVLIVIITAAAHKKANQYTALMMAIPAKAALDIGKSMDLTMDAKVQRELVSNEPWRDEVDAQIAMDRKQDRARSLRAKNSTSELLAGSQPNLSEDSLDYRTVDSNADFDRYAPTSVNVAKPRTEELVVSGDGRVVDKNGDNPSSSGKGVPETANKLPTGGHVESTGNKLPTSNDSEPVEPTANQLPGSKPQSPRYAGLLKQYDPRHLMHRAAGSQSHDHATTTPQRADPAHPLASGPDEFERQFMHPALRPDPPSMWLPRDDLGVADSILRPEIEAATAARFVYEDSTMDRAGKIVVPVNVIARDEEP